MLWFQTQRGTFVATGHIGTLFASNLGYDGWFLRWFCGMMSGASAIRVRVPASSANLGPGFDALALALGLYLRCTLRRSPQGMRITASGTDQSEIPCDSSNLIMRAFCRVAGEKSSDEVELKIENEVPLGKGLGSSAAAIVAGLALGSEWQRFSRGPGPAETLSTKDQLVQLATEIEGHPDNVAAAVRGGLVTSCQGEDGSVLSVNSPLPSNLQVVLIVPECLLSTEQARAALPDQYLRRDAVFNLQRVALLLGALQAGRTELLGEAMQDRLHQPYRAPLVPGFDDLLKFSLEPSKTPGLLGLALSGAGPSVVALCSERAREIGETIGECFRRHAVEAEARQLSVDHEGLVVERVP